MDEIIDYKQVDLESDVEDIDVVLDCVGDSVLDQCFRAMKHDGLLVSINSFGAEAKAEAAGRKGMFFNVSMNADQHTQITQMLEAGILRPLHDSIYPLDKNREVFEYAGAGHVHGKVVISVPE